MSKVIVEKSIHINGPKEKIHDVLTDFTQWKYWSPWYVIEPDSELDYGGEKGKPGSSYNWKGDITGQGEIVLHSIEPNQLKYDVHFVKPARAKAKVQFDLASDASGTQVTWHMRSKVPFFLFFVVKIIEALLGSDIERGLMMLKDYIETGEVDSKVKIIGTTEFDEIRYLGIADSGSINEVGNIMPKHIDQLSKFVKDNSIEVTGPCLAIYSNFELVSKQTNFVTAFQISKDVRIDLNEDSPFTVGNLPSGKVVKIIHTGPYRHLPNAWAASTTYSRVKKIKASQNSGYEIYLDDPTQTDPKNLRSEVCVPII